MIVMIKVLLISTASIDVWKAENRRGLWLEIPLPSHAELIPVAIKVQLALVICSIASCTHSEFISMDLRSIMEKPIIL